jgi:hypothetical protein
MEKDALIAQCIASYTFARYMAMTYYWREYDLAADPENRSMYLTEAQTKEIYGDAFPESWAKLTEAAKPPSNMNCSITASRRWRPTMPSPPERRRARSTAGQRGALSCLRRQQHDKEVADYLTTVTVTKADALRMLNDAAPGLTGLYPDQWFEGGRYSDAGYLLEITIGKADLTGAALRTMFDLRSAAFHPSTTRTMPSPSPSADTGTRVGLSPIRRAGDGQGRQRL